MSEALVEVQVDRLVGPTHHFGGMGIGNLASHLHGGQPANPRAAALEGLRKMRCVADCGARQLVLPPQRRPAWRFLRRVGFRGEPETILRKAAQESPQLLSAAWSASAMWTANAATVTAAVDSTTRKTQITVANLTSSTHRSLEPPETIRLLRSVFADPSFVVRPPLPASQGLRDEGAANHMRLFSPDGQRGIEVFVYGDASEAFGFSDGNQRFPARQTMAASRSVARLHGCHAPLFLEQNPRAVAAGAFHNDVVAASCRDLLLCHEEAFTDATVLDMVAQRYQQHCGRPLHQAIVRPQELSLEEAVATYLFNSQLVASADDPNGPLTLICPQQVAESERARRVVDQWIRGSLPIERVEYVELRESMANGGGPACLRLRVPMTETQWKRLPREFILTDTLAERLEECIVRHYPETIELADLGRPELAHAVTTATTAITNCFGAESNR